MAEAHRLLSIRGPNGVWPAEEARISEWAFETGASKTKVTNVDWQNVRRTSYMDATFGKLGWAIPERPPFLPKDFGGVGKLPYKPYGAALLNGPAPFPERGELKKPGPSSGKTYTPMTLGQAQRTPDSDAVEAPRVVNEAAIAAESHGVAMRAVKVPQGRG